jgi:hypothetical protein
MPWAVPSLLMYFLIIIDGRCFHRPCFAMPRLETAPLGTRRRDVLALSSSVPHLERFCNRSLIILYTTPYIVHAASLCGLTGSQALDSGCRNICASRSGRLRVVVRSTAGKIGIENRV